VPPCAAARRNPGVRRSAPPSRRAPSGAAPGVAGCACRSAHDLDQGHPGRQRRPRRKRRQAGHRPGEAAAAREQARAVDDERQQRELLERQLRGVLERPSMLRATVPHRRERHADQRRCARDEQFGAEQAPALSGHASERRDDQRDDPRPRAAEALTRSSGYSRICLRLIGTGTSRSPARRRRHPPPRPTDRATGRRRRRSSRACATYASVRGVSIRGSRLGTCGALTSCPHRSLLSCSGPSRAPGLTRALRGARVLPRRHDDHQRREPHLTPSIRTSPGRKPRISRRSPAILAARRVFRTGDRRLMLVRPAGGEASRAAASRGVGADCRWWQPIRLHPSPCAGSERALARLTE